MGDVRSVRQGETIEMNNTGEKVCIASCVECGEMNRWLICANRVKYDISVRGILKYEMKGIVGSDGKLTYKGWSVRIN